MTMPVTLITMNFETLGGSILALFVSTHTFTNHMSA